MFNYNHVGIGGIVALFITFAIIGAILGFFIGFCTDIMERQEALVRAEKALYRAKELLYNIAESYQEGDEKFKTREMDSNYNVHTVWTFEGGYDSIYKEVWSIKSKIAPFGSSYLVQFNSLIQKHIQSLNNSIKNKLEELINAKYFSLHDNLISIFHKLTLLKYVNRINCKYDPAIHTLKEFIELLEEKPMYFLQSNAYGNFTLPLDNPKEMIFMDEKASVINENLANILKNVLDNSDGYYCGIVKCMTESFLKMAGKLMWYYAKKKPFNVNKFEEARALYNRYTSDHLVPGRYAKSNSGEHTFIIGKVEEILAVLYSKNQIGGKGTVQQEREYIDVWLENKISSKSVKECNLFVSGLAWLELYELELEALHKMVQGNIQLSAELQERLHFLEVGGTSSNVKVYETEPESHFVYDSSSENWNANEFNVFFRKVGMKKLKLNYSLAISSWKKTLPLSSGQNASMNDLYCEFRKMTKDFGGEVSCTRTKAKAVDLDNVSYPDAVVFQFTSERNKCLSMLFSCEKFGRNLNITIITLFTPEIGMDVESMQKYATAIKSNSNIYVDSFRETILQAVDEVIKEEKNIYDDESNSSSGKKFVE